MFAAEIEGILEGDDFEGDGSAGKDRGLAARRLG